MIPKKEKPRLAHRGLKDRARETNTADIILEALCPNCQAKFGRVAGLLREVRP